MLAIRQSSKLKFPKWPGLGQIIALCLSASSGPAWAYRPFDGTDAAVAATVINYGLSEGWESVLQGQGQTPLSPSGPTSLTSAGAFLKHVIQPGSLQDKIGPSVATEFGMLLPDSTGSSGVGASLAGIVSQRWDWGTIHLNAASALTRDHHADVFLGGIIEGPSKWSIRPVAEFFYEREFGQSETISGLVGLIWRVRDNLSFDVGLRHALTNGHPVNEVRAGLTFGFPLGLFGGHTAQTK